MNKSTKWRLIVILILLVFFSGFWFLIAMLSFIYFVLGLIVYFIPTIIARKKSFVLQVFLLNLLLGWSLLGWCVALIWSVKKDN